MSFEKHSPWRGGRYDLRREPMTDAAHQLTEFVLRHRKVVVLTGAGCSTESGIPDYRDEQGRWKHKKPMPYAAFVNHPANRRRYWAQSFSGWRRVAAAMPNRAHHALARLERRGFVSWIVTQNVDGLHQRAGSRHVIDLHGVLDRVRCLSCGGLSSRGAFQDRLTDANPRWRATVENDAPDGDAKISRQDFDSFVVPGCLDCGGIFKPDVVFFGESVPKDRVATVHRHVEGASALLVVGSSLMVFSGFRFVRSASHAGKPIAIVNRGATRADALAAHKLSGNCADILASVADRIEPERDPR